MTSTWSAGLQEASVFELNDISEVIDPGVSTSLGDLHLSFLYGTDCVAREQLADRVSCAVVVEEDQRDRYHRSDVPCGGLRPCV